MDQARISWFGQVSVYIGKCFRTFVNESGWKLLVSSAIIVIIISAVAGSNMFITLNATNSGAFAFVCAFIWIGIFNSIQSICRERAIIKREYRTGLRISAYISAHMIYEMILCFAQAFIAVIILFIMSSPPAEGIFMPPFIELLITFFLVIFAADALGMLVSCIVKTETAAMSVMPFVLILQLVLAGIVFELEGIASNLSYLTISRWGVNAICTIANVNKMAAEAVAGVPDMLHPFLLPANFNESYFYFSAGHLTGLWFTLIGFVLLYGLLATIGLKFIDRDKR